MILIYLKNNQLYISVSKDVPDVVKFVVLTHYTKNMKSNLDIKSEHLEE